MPEVFVEATLCTRCGACEATCPIGILRQGGDQAAAPVPERVEYCIQCGHCVAACPVAAVSTDAISPQRCRDFQPSRMPTVGQMAEVIRSRRSIRRFEDRPVQREKFERLLDLVAWAPTARNHQSIEWIIVESKATVRELAGLVVEALRPHERYAFFVDAWDAGGDIIHRDAPHLIVAHMPSAISWRSTDCAIAMATLELAATTLGLGTCWAGVFMAAAAVDATIARRLGIPEDRAVGAAQMIGYPDETFVRIPPRDRPVAHYLA